MAMVGMSKLIDNPLCVLFTVYDILVCRCVYVKVYTGI